MSVLEAKKNVILNFQGPMVAVATPLDTEGNLDTSHIENYTKYLVNNGAKGFYILGTTGEGYSLTLKEKVDLIGAWRAALDKTDPEHKLVSIVNVSSTCVPEIHQLAREVERLNFDGIALLPPIYYQNPSLDHLVNYIKQILSKSASTTPFLYYHIPSFTGELKFELESFLEKGLAQIPQFAAIKFTDENMARYGRVQSKFGTKIKILAGFDETLLPTTTMGGEAAICALFNLKGFPSKHLAIVEAVKQNNLDEARRIQQQIADRCAQLKQNGNFFQSLKAELNKETKSSGLFFGNPREPIVIN